MTSNSGDRESRRSMRIRLKVQIEALGVSEPLTCEGETLVVNLHGALLLTSAALRVGMKIGIHVLLTGKRAIADVVHARQIQRFGRCEKFPTPIVPLLL